MYAYYSDPLPPISMLISCNLAEHRCALHKLQHWRKGGGEVKKRDGVQEFNCHIIALITFILREKCKKLDIVNKFCRAVSE